MAVTNLNLSPYTTGSQCNFDIGLTNKNYIIEGLCQKSQNVYVSIVKESRDQLYPEQSSQVSAVHFLVSMLYTI